MWFIMLDEWIEIILISVHKKKRNKLYIYCICKICFWKYVIYLWNNKNVNVMGVGLPDAHPLVLMAEITRESDNSKPKQKLWFLQQSPFFFFLYIILKLFRFILGLAMDTEFLRTVDRQILLGVFVAFVAAGAGAAYFLSSSKKRRGSILNLSTFSIRLCWISIQKCVDLCKGYV